MRKNTKMKLNLNSKIKTLFAILTVLLFFGVSYLLYTPKEQVVLNVAGSKTFTTEDLSKYNGSNPELPIYIGLNGVVYDVSQGAADFYAKGKSYNYLTGKDSSKELNLIGGSIIKKKYPAVGTLVK